MNQRYWIIVGGPDFNGRHLVWAKDFEEAKRKAERTFPTGNGPVSVKEESTGKIEHMDVIGEVIYWRPGHGKAEKGLGLFPQRRSRADQSGYPGMTFICRETGERWEL